MWVVSAMEICGLFLQVRAMQIIDELETSRRGPYGGGIGHVAFTGSMDMVRKTARSIVHKDLIYAL